MRLETLKRIRDKKNQFQQAQSEPSNNLVDVDVVREDFITEVYRVLDADSTNDRANAIIDAFDSLPTVSQEQPEVEFEVKFAEFLERKDAELGAKSWSEDDLRELALYFYYGRKKMINSRRWIWSSSIRT